MSQKSLDAANALPMLEAMSTETNSQKTQLNAFKATLYNNVGGLSNQSGATSRSVVSFWRDVHYPFIELLHNVMNEFATSLQSINSELTGEFSAVAHIREDFMMNDLQDQLEDLKRTAENHGEGLMDLSFEYSDVVSLPSFNYSSIIDGLNQSIREINQTLELLHSKDASLKQTQVAISESISTLHNYLSTISSKISSGSISITNFNSSAVKDTSEWKAIQSENFVRRYHQALTLMSADGVGSNSTRLIASAFLAASSSGVVPTGDLLYKAIATGQTSLLNFTTTLATNDQFQSQMKRIRTFGILMNNSGSIAGVFKAAGQDLLNRTAHQVAGGLVDFNQRINFAKGVFNGVVDVGQNYLARGAAQLALNPTFQSYAQKVSDFDVYERIDFAKKWVNDTDAYATLSRDLVNVHPDVYRILISMTKQDIIDAKNTGLSYLDNTKSTLLNAVGSARNITINLLNHDKVNAFKNNVASYNIGGIVNNGMNKLDSKLNNALSTGGAFANRYIDKAKIAAYNASDVAKRGLTQFNQQVKSTFNSVATATSPYIDKGKDSLSRGLNTAKNQIIDKGGRLVNSQVVKSLGPIGKGITTLSHTSEFTSSENENKSLDVKTTRFVAGVGTDLGTTAIGAGIGGALGTALIPIPGVGTAVGAFVGGYIGGKVADKVVDAAKDTAEKALNKAKDTVSSWFK